MSEKFAEYSRFDLSAVNKEMLRDWDAKDVFRKSTELREGQPSFVFYEGPPSANGMPGIHHMIARSIKDIFCRYKTMKGYRVNRKAGWDTHGLPVELGVEKSLGITKEDIGRKISVEDYNAACRRDVMKFTHEWEDLTRKMGYWVDMKDPYITYDNRYIETLWWLLKQLYNKGLLYKGYTIQPYSPAAGTGLSTHELNQPGCYRDVKDTTVTALFRMTDPRPEMTGWGTPCFVAWTTTPWTLPSNTALCVGPEIDYVAVQTYNPYTADKVTLVMAESCVASYFKPEGAVADMEVFQPGDKVVPYRLLPQRYKGSSLVGMKYVQLMPWVKPLEKLDGNAPAYVKVAAESHPDTVFAIGKDTYVEMSAEAFRVIPGDYVTTEEGTGIVHIAPTFGADDAKVGKASGVPSLFMVNLLGETRPMVDLTGKYYLLSDCAPEFTARCVDEAAYCIHEGEYVKNAYDPAFNPGGKYDEAAAAKAEDLNIRICMEMKQAGQALRIEKHVHNYPHCWRTDKPVLYYPLDSWFIRSTACRDRMIELNRTINWKPESTGSGRFGKWLENLNDWNLSRSRYWGTPLPVWRNRDTREEICIGSVEELYREIEKSVAAGLMKENPYKKLGFVPGLMDKANYDKIDLHRPYVDDIVLVSASGQPMHREPDLIDVWFDSGAMPYAQIHYPFENKEAFDKRKIYPADFIAEGVDQTRGWFFTLHALATMVFDSVAYKNVVSNGLVLDKNGNKMSKRLGNAVDPFGAIEQYGSDPLRWYMITNASPWDNLRFDTEGVEEVRRKFFGTLYNTYSFFALYANVDGFTGHEEEIPVAERPEIDRWIISLLHTLIRQTDQSYADYEATRSGRAIAEFVGENLSNWYVRLNRKRFWGGEMTRDKLAAYQTLYTCLDTVARLMAPIAPFYADRLFLDLNAVTGRDRSESVHLAAYPVFDEKLIDEGLNTRMQLAQQISSMVLSLRKKVNIKVRQPLSAIIIPEADSSQKAAIEAVRDLILSEVNVKELRFVDNAAGILIKRIKPDFKKLGPKCGKQMKSVAEMLKNLQQDVIFAFEKAGYLDLTVDGQALRIEAADVEFLSEDIPGWLVANDGRLTVALEVEISESLREEGLARELVNRIQNLRKSQGFEITDRIRIQLTHHEATDRAVLHWQQYIASQTLAESVSLEDSLTEATLLDMEEAQVMVKVTKV
ncbi:MAG: isoleucine--tRNA ligase [Bacteroidales bacterium]|nr:isoleucine--tRNA ligase [Bacteroidales bacterium]